MRRSMVLIQAGLVGVLALAGIAAQTDADDDYDQRISDLETRVATLEAVVGVAPAGADGQPGQDGSSSIVSSSQSSSSGVSSFSASYAANGDREYPLEIKNGGEYYLVVHLITAPITLEIVTESGEPVPGFSAQGNPGEVLTRSSSLEPGNYVLRVSTTSQWGLTLVSSGT